MSKPAILEWENFLDPAVVRPRLIAASIYIASFEVLKNTIVDRIRSFYSIGFDESGAILSPKYRGSVLVRSKSPVYASLDWLKEHDAVDADDISSFDQLKKFRNALAHELLSTLGTEGLPTEFAERISEVGRLLRKIEVWWIQNVEIPTSPDQYEEDVEADDILPGSVLFLGMLVETALGKEKDGHPSVDKTESENP